MASYSRTEFSRHTKEQLLDYIEQQNEQLNRFETRFRDVVHAYRGALKEKVALESTLRALSVQQEDAGGSGGEITSERADSSQQKEEESDGYDSSVRTAEESANEMDDAASEGHLLSSPRPPKSSARTHTTTQLKQQLNTLTAAMATLTGEKSKMETSFQKDKKTVMSQQELLTKQLQTEKESLKKELVECQDLLREVQDSLRSEQAARSEEQTIHAEMLRELQCLIATEREDKEKLILKVQSREVEVERLQRQISEDRTIEYEENLRIMSVELEQVRSRLMAAEKQAHQPPPLLLQLQEDMAKMKEEHLKAIEAEQRRANLAETSLHSQEDHEELRVASLEQKLTELSKTVGNYDQQRETDQMAIQKLKERIAHLDSENTVLTKVHLERQDTLSNEAYGQVSVLQEKLSRMKALLKQATFKISEKTTLPSDVEELTVSDYNEMLSQEPSRKEYEQELYLVKEEFEKYKTRAQSVLKSRGNKMDSEVTNEELKKFAKQNRDLQEQLLVAQSNLEEQEEKQLVRTRKQREEMRDIHDKHRQNVAALENANKQKLHELSTQMQSTRERSLKLISEKDSEILCLKSELLEACSSQPSTPTTQHRYKNQYSRNLSTGSASSLSDQVSALHPSSGGVTGQLGTHMDRENSLESSVEPNNDTSSLNLPLKPSCESDSNSQSAVQELLDQPSPLSLRFGGLSGLTSTSEVRLLHHAQEQLRRKEESITARRKMFELEDTIRELQEREERYLEQTGFLKEEIRKLQRDRSRETENLEYLKNIIIHFMSADSAGGSDKEKHCC